MMDSLAELIPGIGDAIRVGKLSFQVGEMIGKYIADKENERDSGIVTWRRIDVFLKEHPLITEDDISFSDLFLHVITCCIYGVIALFVFGLNRFVIKSNADDIEVTYSEYKMIRKNNGRMGLCQWGKGFKRKLLLSSEYTIIKGFDNSYIVKNKKGKYGLYNAEIKSFVARCEYNAITLYSSNAYLAIQGEYVSLMNSKGDRV